MPCRTVKEFFWRWPLLNQLSDMAERHYYRILPMADDHGCFESTPEVVCGLAYPLKRQIKPQDVKKWQDEMERVGVLRRWQADGREFALLLDFARQNSVRHLVKRKTPEPPADLLTPVIPPAPLSSSGPLAESGTSPSTIETKSPPLVPPPPPAKKPPTRRSPLTLEDKLARAVSELQPEYPELPVAELAKDCAQWWRDKKQDMRNPKAALRTWLSNARKRQVSSSRQPSSGIQQQLPVVYHDSDQYFSEKAQADQARAEQLGAFADVEASGSPPTSLPSSSDKETSS